MPLLPTLIESIAKNLTSSSASEISALLEKLIILAEKVEAALQAEANASSSSASASNSAPTSTVQAQPNANVAQQPKNQ